MKIWRRQKENKQKTQTSKKQDANVKKMHELVKKETKMFKKSLKSTKTSEDLRKIKSEHVSLLKLLLFFAKIHINLLINDCKNDIIYGEKN